MSSVLWTAPTRITLANNETKTLVQVEGLTNSAVKVLEFCFSSTLHMEFHVARQSAASDGSALTKVEVFPVRPGTPQATARAAGANDASLTHTIIKRAEGRQWVWDERYGDELECEPGATHDFIGFRAINRGGASAEVSFYVMCEE